MQVSSRWVRQKRNTESSKRFRIDVGVVSKSSANNRHIVGNSLVHIANPSEIQHGVALLVARLVLMSYYVKGATFYIVTVSRLGGLGHQNFSRSACRQPGAATPVLRGLPGSDESRASQTKRPGGSTGCWLGRCLVPIGR